MPQVFIVQKEKKPYFVGLIADIKTSEYQQLIKECEERHNQEEQEKKQLLKRVSDLEKEISQLKGRLLLDEGKITQEDFDNGRY